MAVYCYKFIGMLKMEILNPAVKCNKSFLL